MMLTAGRKTNEIHSPRFRKLPVAAGVLIFEGAQVGLDPNGNLVPASQRPDLAIMGCAYGRADNRTGLAGQITCVVGRGVLGWDNAPAGPDQIGPANIGQTVYAVDDGSVALTAGGAPATRSAAGRVFTIEGSTVYVEVF